MSPSLNHPAVRKHEHQWKRVPPHIHITGEPLLGWDGLAGRTYNAQCATCGAVEWMHWAPIQEDTCTSP